MEIILADLAYLIFDMDACIYVINIRLVCCDIQ